MSQKRFPRVRLIVLRSAFAIVVAIPLFLPQLHGTPWLTLMVAAGWAAVAIRSAMRKTGYAMPFSFMACCSLVNFATRTLESNGNGNDLLISRLDWLATVALIAAFIGFIRSVSYSVSYAEESAPESPELPPGGGVSCGTQG